jgi:hypothetical protein
MSSVYLGEFNSRLKNTGQHCTYPDWLLYQHGEISGPRANSGPRHLAAMPAKLFVSLLLFTISSFIFLIAKDLKILRFQSRLLNWVEGPHMLLTLKSCC